MAILSATLLAACAAQPPAPKQYQPIPLGLFSDGIHHWQNLHGKDYPRYREDQIVEIANNVLLYQRDNGGWIENRDPARILDDSDIKAAEAEKANPKGSFDNRNVYSQVEYLFAAYDQTGNKTYRQAALKGLRYTLSMQHKKCGGWPHTVPGAQPYHPYITMADEVTSGVLRMLRKVEQADPPFKSVDAADRTAATDARKRGDACVLQLQVRQNDKLAGWAGQYDPETLQPAQGRSFELPSMVSQESVEMARYLMSIPAPSPEVVAAIDGVMAWFERSKLTGWKIETIKLDQPVKYDYHTATTDRRLVQDPDAGPLWGRFYDVKDNSIVLANRDGIRVKDYSQIHHERRTGYAWYGVWPTKVLYEEYPAWKKRMGRG
ncbi:MAG: pectate lyase [Candidatus Dactylopiibacterium carminicum]|uniref:Pectate lyase n=2 Tax=Candidatus Dactylopiibacterium carminicum TaxID=857335 RepID=A0A272EUI4_9RHOO|nr:pectate lyase [Candidatus Dactylopiibacterium carminicum]PAS93754.1 MAG: pectate lyase [Candidatus Dactylopiibacterium carminicum]PAS98346.1 MAG: pectate lyase [Candidatus Dactylopiibacterium carminicum]PAS99800.1 MAG: pectate lyase [Candidatus Dactylopiibacterium carminicum]